MPLEMYFVLILVFFFFQSNFMINLLVKKKIEKLSKLTSNPKRVNEAIQDYMGIQCRHQSDLGRMWFMRTMVNRNVYSHELQTLAWRTLYGYNWRQRKILDQKMMRQCRSILNTRLAVAEFNISKLAKDNKKTIRVIEKNLSDSKLRMPIRMFRNRIAQI